MENIEANSSADGDFVNLIVTHQPLIRGRIISLLPGVSEVDDIIQNVNLVIWNKRESYAPKTNFKAWLNSIIRYEILTHWRTQQRRKEFTFPEDVFDLLLEESTSQIDQDIMDERLPALRLCISTLRAEDRALILQRYVHPTSIAELSLKTNRSANSLRVALHRIRTSLRLCVKRRLSLNAATPN
ncbi:sigma-70 family RNA polymerase sigma factor [Verrucomicrobiaceae bacterium R5-34]|uniref:Sigma-70 family RNA polymerase sigma factor n=1 Tax=Oceaniferula flava TaxID=2800421 RepID=A0AAE2SD51_9BACT|nr:sigma-70 family RNA polymerase sigma factor [Oceaniferula flavus]MBK1832352.1 sigma-70 family RNA polymerase sigma factor [Verrucomicrobiaceae bacterium R5-34]MBK1856203.1 sigma-70 family RNA polymerase sigma factor [Oceaniferula flavus]MBM1137510.1 sigma-70 family RNA polymerase sigma factor [Oceaniferula flavus]